MIPSLFIRFGIQALKYGLPVLIGLSILWGVDHSYRALKNKVSTAEQENAELQQAVNAQSNRANAAESNVSLLTQQLHAVQAENADYQQKQRSLHAKQEQEDEKAKEEAAQLSRGLNAGNVRDSRVPDSVIRLQQQAICRANGGCSRQ